jgi:hypothetical protein
MKAQEAVLNGTSCAMDGKAKWQCQSTGVKGVPKGKGKGKFDKDAPGRDDKKEDQRRDKGKGGERK